MPAKMEDLAHRLGVEEVPTLNGALAENLAGRSVIRGDPLVPRAELQR
jgi:hypothetical protein